MSRARSGGEASLVRILEFFQPEVVQMIRKRGIHQNDHQDAVQDSVIAIMDCIRREPDNFLHYTRKVLRQRLNMFFGEKLLPEMEMELVEAKDTSYHQRNHKEVTELLGFLPGKKRRMIKQYYGIECEERSMGQIAALTGLSRAEVKKELVESLTLLSEIGHD